MPVVPYKRTVDLLVTITSTAPDNRTQSTHTHALEMHEGESVVDFMMRVRGLIERAINLDEGYPR